MKLVLALDDILPYARDIFLLSATDTILNALRLYSDDQKTGGMEHQLIFKITFTHIQV